MNYLSIYLLFYIPIFCNGFLIVMYFLMNTEILKIIYMTHVKDMFSYGMAYYSDTGIVEDAIHDVFLDIYRRKVQIDEIGNVKHYLFAALRHRILCLKEQTGLFESLDSYDSCDFVESEYDDLEWLEEETNKKQFVNKMLSRLSLHQREVMYLRLAETLSFAQIAEIMKINRQSAQNLFGRAINKLRKEFVI